MNTELGPLADAAKRAFEAYHTANPDPDLNIWNEIAGAVVRALLDRNAAARPGDDPRRWAQLVAAAVYSSIGEHSFSDALSHGCLALKQGEPFFVLRGQDRLAPGAIRAWIASAEQSSVPEIKIAFAECVLETMERWGGDRKYPD